MAKGTNINNCSQVSNEVITSNTLKLNAALFRLSAWSTKDVIIKILEKDSTIPNYYDKCQSRTFHDPNGTNSWMNSNDNIYDYKIFSTKPNNHTNPSTMQEKLPEKGLVAMCANKHSCIE